MTRFYEEQRRCTECGEAFWGTRNANFCSAKCKVRQWRARNALQRSAPIIEVCEQMLARRVSNPTAYAKLLPRLFRACATELRARGWDPIALLLSRPDEPITGCDEAPGGIEGAPPGQRRWLHSPEREIELLEEAIVQRKQQHRSVHWHVARRAQLKAALEARADKQRVVATP